MAFLPANCRLMISGFSERALTVSGSDSTTFSPSSVLTGVFRASDRAMSRLESGMDSPVSQWKTACRVTCTFSVNCSWGRPHLVCS